MNKVYISKAKVSLHGKFFIRTVREQDDGICIADIMYCTWVVEEKNGVWYAKEDYRIKKNGGNEATQNLHKFIHMNFFPNPSGGYKHV